jgi:hypothetical protein
VDAILSIGNHLHAFTPEVLFSVIV